MFGFKLPISAKLGFVGVLALLTVGAIGLNEMWDRADRAQLAAEADGATTARIAMLQAAVATRRLVIMGRDVRLAATSAIVDDVFKRANGFAADGLKAFDAAAAAEPPGSTRDGIDRAKDLTRQYLTAVGEVAAARKEILDLQNRLGEQGVGWIRTMSALLGSPELAALPNAAEVTHALERADFYSASARSALWAYFVRGDKSSQARTTAALENSTKFLKQARSTTGDPKVAPKIDEFLKFAPLYAETNDQIGRASCRERV